MLEMPTIILASGSRTRHELLKSAAVAFTVIPADIDEDAIRLSVMAEADDGGPDAADVAEILALTKGQTVSAANPGSLVIAADQTLACGGELFTKPRDENAARDTLMKLRGRTHQLHSAVVIARDGEIVWSLVDTAHLTMRKFSAAFVEEYSLRTGADICDSVGAYRLEGMGIQLFEKVDGDYFTILGLPLLPLLNELRAEGALTA